MIEKRELLSKTLPPISVSEQTSIKVREIAKKEGVTISEVVRTAVRVFLSEYNSKAIEN